MHTKALCLLLLVCSPFFASAQKFATKTIRLKTDAPLQSAALHQKQQFCLTADHKLFVISAADKLQELPVKVDEKIHSIVSLRDTLFAIGEENRIYHFNGNSFVYLRQEELTPHFYADERYTVSQFCRGEFGGSVNFTDNTSGVQYDCPATCPVMVSKFNGSYIVTASLAHRSGSSKIIRIKDPSKIAVELPKSQREDADPDRAVKGTEKLLQVYGFLTLATFAHDKKMYHIVSDNKKLFIARISGKQFDEEQPIGNIPSLSPETVTDYGEEGLLSMFSGEGKGFIRIKDNSVKVYSFTAKNRQ